MFLEDARFDLPPVMLLSANGEALRRNRLFSGLRKDSSMDLFSPKTIVTGDQNKQPSDFAGMFRQQAKPSTFKNKYKS